MPASSVTEIITAFLHRVEKAPASPITAETPLFADGLGLDSLETAELSAMLEDELGSDPFNQAEMPETVGSIQAFYGAEATGAS